MPATNRQRVKPIHWGFFAPCLTLVLLVGASAFAQAPTTQSTLALRFWDIAQATARSQSGADESTLRQVASLMEAASRTDPAEPRYFWLLADARMRLKDDKGALDAITAFRKLRPEDREAQLQYIALVVDRMETADDKLNYLRGVLGKEVVPAEIRSEIARRIAVLLMEKKQESDALAMLDQAIALNPVNTAALRARFDLTAANATPAERFSMRLDLLKANPRDLAAVSDVANQLAQAGMVNDALTWYGHTFQAFVRSGEGVTESLARAAASELFIGGKIDDARGLLDQYLKANPDDATALELRILVEKQAGQEDSAKKFRDQARNALLNNLAIVRQKIGVKEATTRPVKEGPEALPDLARDVELAKKLEKPDVKADYLNAVGEVAWFELFFDGQTADAEKLLSVINALRDPADKSVQTFVTRMEGWIFLTQPTKLAEARVKLDAVKDADPMAALGLVRAISMDKAGAEQAKAEGNKLMSRYPSGMVGAMIWDGLRDLGVKVTPGEGSAAMKDALAKFPSDWMKILANPNMFYSVRGEPVRISYGTAEPIMARVTIMNSSDYDISIGDDGTLSPTLWFDVQMNVAGQIQTVPGAFVDRITDQIVLRRHQTLTRLVRIDQGQVNQILFLYNMPPVTFTVVVRTNVPFGKTIQSAPAGQAVEFVRKMERAAMSQDGFQRMMSAAGNADEPVMRMRAFEVLAARNIAFRRLAESDAQKAPDAQKTADATLEPVRKARNADDPAVSAWAQYLVGAYGDDKERGAVVTRMLSDSDWQSRILGISAALPTPVLNQAFTPALPAEQLQTALTQMAEKESEQFIKAYAQATVHKLKNPPTTQPAK